MISKKVKFLVITLVLSIIITSCVKDQKENIDIPDIDVVETIEDGNSLPEIDISKIDKEQKKYNEYDINLEINPETNIVKCVEKIKYYNTSEDSLDSVYFNIYLNAFSKDAGYQPYFSEFKDKIFYDDKDFGYINISTVFVDSEETNFNTDVTRLEVDLKEPLLPNKSIEIALQFEAYIPKINGRTGSNENAVWMGNFFPVVAVYEDGYFRTDTYYKAGDPFYNETSNYTVSVKAPSEYRAIGPGKSETVTEDGIKTTTFTAKMIRDFSLVLIDEEYRELTAKTGDIEITMYYISDIENVDNIILGAKNAIEFFNEYVGGYPYNKFDIIETGMFIDGGMEYSQQTFIDGKFLKSSGAKKAISHEIAHQWFYNVVGSDQINAPWMDEGLTSYLQEKIYYKDDESFQKKFMEDYHKLEQTKVTTYKLTDDLSIYKNWSEYYTTQHTKGKLMIFSLNNKMGEEKFQEFIKLYFTRYSFEIATVEDFINTAEEVYGKGLSGFFDSWIHEEKLPPLYN